MRCRINDLAVIVRSNIEENQGKLVKVEGIGLVRNWIVKPLSPIFLRHFLLTGNPCTVTDPFSEIEIDDNQLMPLRDNPGEDETFIWTDKPLQMQPADLSL